jgi:hypothetical protein
MTTESVLKALDEYDSIMQKYAPTLPPVIWDRKKRKLVYNRVFSNRKTTFWHCGVLLTVELGFGGGGALILFMQLFRIGGGGETSLSLFQNLALLVILTAGIMMTGFHILLVMYGEPSSNAWNQLVSLEKEMDNFCKPHHYSTI